MSADADDALSLFNIGPYEDGLAAIGMRSEVYGDEFPISNPTAQLFCGQLKDTNPSYWDEDFARKIWGGLIAPFSLLWAFGHRMPWKPNSAERSISIFLQIPLPGNSAINASTEATYFKPLKIGDRLHGYDEIIAIGPEKTTKLGTGHFVTGLSSYFNQNEELIGTVKNVVFRYIAHPSK